MLEKPELYNRRGGSAYKRKSRSAQKKDAHKSLKRDGDQLLKGEEDQPLKGEGHQLLLKGEGGSAAPKRRKESALLKEKRWLFVPKKSLEDIRRKSPLKKELASKCRHQNVDIKSKIESAPKGKGSS